MEWNNLLTELNYYLAEMYVSDIPGNDNAKRLLKIAGVKTIGINFTNNAVSSWFNIINYAAQRDQLVDLLKVITSANEGNEKDQFLLGLIKNLEEKTDPVKRLDLVKWESDPMDKATKEKIIGKKTTLLPITFLEQGLIVSKAVVRINVEKELGTGFIIKNNWLITNNHVINSIAKAKKAVIEFNYQYRTNKSGVIELASEESFTLNPGNSDADNLFFTNESEDWTIVKLNADPVTKFGYLELAQTSVEKEDFVNIIQHPAGGAKQLAIYNNMVMFTDDAIVQYLTDTLPGSSGSPVFNSNWQVVALHHSGGWVKEPGNDSKVYRNQGTNILKLNSFIREKGLQN